MDHRVLLLSAPSALQKQLTGCSLRVQLQVFHSAAHQESWLPQKVSEASVIFVVKQQWRGEWYCAGAVLFLLTELVTRSKNLLDLGSNLVSVLGLLAITAREKPRPQLHALLVCENLVVVVAHDDDVLRLQPPVDHPVRDAWEQARLHCSLRLLAVRYAPLHR